MPAESNSYSSSTTSDTETVTVHYRSNETYIDQKICVYNPPGRQLQPYDYSFPFTLQLPPQIPSSFVGSVGRVTYFVRANVHRAGMHLANKLTLPFSVVGIKDLNYLPLLQHPLALENYKTFGMLCCASKPLIAQLSINKQAFVSGENILVSGLIKNESKTKITRCDLKLLKLVHYYAMGKTRCDKLETVFECSQPGVDKESEETWQNVPVFVPSLPPSQPDGCHSIDIKYFLKVRVVPSGLSLALELTFNITIGTIPFRQHVIPPPPVLTAGDAVPPPDQYNIPGPSGGAPSGAPSAPYVAAPPDSSAPLAPPSGNHPPYGDLQPTFGEYCGDSNQPPAYDSLFKGAKDNADHDEQSRNYMPKYPSFNISS